MGLLYELESQADEIIVERMRQTIADALSGYKPMREERDVAMARYHIYSVNANRQIRRDTAGRPYVSLRRLRRNDQRHGCHRQVADAKATCQKKVRDEAMRLAAQGVSYERVGNMLELAKSALQVVKAGRMRSSRAVGRDIGTR